MLFHDGGPTPVDTETVAVTGNGMYTTPSGFALPTTGTVTGTYQWNASYSGDTNNGSVSENNAANEQVTVSVASPTITTAPDLTTVTLGTTAVTLKDTADLEGGFHPTGTIIFTLFHNGGPTPVDTEVVTVTGNGTYTTPTGFALPATGTVTGTYQWDATYNGDANNNAVSDTGAANERVTVSAASPTISTTPSPTHGHAGHDAGDAQRHCVIGGRLQPERHDHLHAPPGQHPVGHRDGRRHRQRDVHDADRLHAADERHGDRHLPVECQLQRRHQQRLGQRQQRRRRAGDGQRGQPHDQHGPRSDHGHAGHDGAADPDRRRHAVGQFSARRARSPSRCSTTAARRRSTPRPSPSTATAPTPRRPASRCRRAGR